MVCVEVAEVVGVVDAVEVAVDVIVDVDDVDGVLVADVVGDDVAVVVRDVVCVVDGLVVCDDDAVVVALVVGVLLWHAPKVPSTKALTALLKFAATASQSPSTWNSPSELHPIRPLASG